jgi:DnaJ-class molecular chaperone
MDDLDPYAELDVLRTASADEIKSAYKKRAKQVHPDRQNGSTEKMMRASRAVAILTDPAKRKQYDETGFADDQPDNIRANALQIIEAFLGAQIDAYVNNQNPAVYIVDPRRRDLLGELRIKLTNEIRDTKLGIEKGKAVKIYIQDLMCRISGKDQAKPIERMFENRLRGIEAQIQTLEEAIAAREMAIKITTNYKIDTSEELDLVKAAVG